MSVNVKDMYERTDEIREKRRLGRIYCRSKEAKWEVHPHTEDTCRIKFLIMPELGFDTDLGMFIEEIPPGGKNNLHRHNEDAIKFLLFGRGYETIDGKKYELEQGDAILIPSSTWHQTINTDLNNPLRFLAICVTYMTFYQMEELMETKRE